MELKFLENVDYYKSSLIDYSNLKSGIIYPQKKFFNKEDFIKYRNNYSMGIPILAPLGLDYFEYDLKNKYTLSQNDISELIFSSVNENYIGVERFVSRGLNFCSEVIPKNKYLDIVKLIDDYNIKQKNIIKKYSIKGYSIAAFQTRNLPHFGHETIINYLLEKVDYVVINPLVGPKKKNDINFSVLIKAYEYLIDNKFNDRLMILPVIANMFYAGPREACHHAIIRKNLGFTHFVVGRDHAGAENIYKPELAVETVKKYEKEIDIKILDIKGAAYCQKCKKSIIIGSCNHNNIFLKDISGSDFRKSLKGRQEYKYADIGLQKFIYKYQDKIFIN